MDRVDRFRSPSLVNYTALPREARGALHLELLPQPRWEWKPHPHLSTHFPHQAKAPRKTGTHIGLPRPTAQSPTASSSCPSNPPPGPDRQAVLHPLGVVSSFLDSTFLAKPSWQARLVFSADFGSMTALWSRPSICCIKQKQRNLGISLFSNDF